MLRLLLGLTILLMASCATSDGSEEVVNESAGEVNVYSHRHYDIDKEIFERFQKETGIAVNVIKAKADELMQKIEMEGENSPADLLVTVDAGRLHRAIQKDLLSPINENEFNRPVPRHFVGPDRKWVALTMRSRILAYSKDRVNPEELGEIESLTDPRWKGKILVRSSSNIYNQSLMASLIVHHKKEGALEWAKGMVENFARAPKGNDRDQVKAIYAGEGDVAIVNSYYIGKLLTSENEEEVKAGESVGVYFPNPERGSHVNISGAGICKHAPNRENAVRLLNFLLSDDIQSMYSEGNHEYPVMPGAKTSDLLSSWGEFKKDQVTFSAMGALNAEAVKIFDEAGWE